MGLAFHCRPAEMYTGIYVVSRTGLHRASAQFRRVCQAHAPSCTTGQVFRPNSPSRGERNWFERGCFTRFGSLIIPLRGPALYGLNIRPCFACLTCHSHTHKGAGLVLQGSWPACQKVCLPIHRPYVPRARHTLEEVEDAQLLQALCGALNIGLMSTTTIMAKGGTSGARVGRLLGLGTRLPPPPSLPSGPTYLPRVNSYRPYIWWRQRRPKIFFIPLAHVASLPAQAVGHPNTILEPNLDSNDHPNPQPAPNPTPNPTHDPNPNQD